MKTTTPGIPCSGKYMLCFEVVDCVWMNEFAYVMYMCSCKWVCMGLSTLFTKLHPGATQQRWRMKCDGSVHRSLNPNSICVRAKHTHTHNTHAHTHTHIHTHRSSLTAPVSLPSCSFLSSSLSTVSSVWPVHDGLWCLFLSLPNKVVKIQLSEQSVLPF